MTELIHSCRSCGAETEIVLSLGRTPLANRLLRADQLHESEPLYPLDLAFCPRCTLVQITETVPPEELFSEYVYFSSYSDTAVTNAQSIAERMIEERKLGRESRVVEIASNDGYLLRTYVREGVPVLGIEPASNIAATARARGVETVAEFFGAELAARLRASGVVADVIHANNVLAHVADLNGFVEGIGNLLAPNGIAVIEVPYLLDLIDRCEFDTIYHEHLCYFSVTALQQLFERHQLLLYDIERLSIHGGSLRLFVAHSEVGERQQSVTSMLESERAWGVAEAGTYRSFSLSVSALGSSLLEMLRKLKASGARIAAYGASAKGSTLLNTVGIGRDVLDFVVDRSDAKQGKFTPGTHLPIHAPEKLLEDRPEYVLLLTWNFADEILAQQEAYRRGGGRFIIPVPEPAVI